jgi:hypothetical protein
LRRFIQILFYPHYEISGPFPKTKYRQRMRLKQVRMSVNVATCSTDKKPRGTHWKARALTCLLARTPDRSCLSQRCSKPQRPHAFGFRETKQFA